MDPTLWTFPRPGFRIEYNSFERFTDCGGNYSDASGNLYSPNYPNNYFNDDDKVSDECITNRKEQM